MSVIPAEPRAARHRSSLRRAEGVDRARLTGRPWGVAVALLALASIMASGREQRPETELLFNTSGVTGFGDVIDARSPTWKSQALLEDCFFRFGAGYQGVREDLELDGAVRAEFRSERQAGVLFGGVAIPLVRGELGLSLRAYEEAHLRTKVRGPTAAKDDDRDYGVGTLGLLAKVALPLKDINWLHLAPYAGGRVTLGGDHDLEEPSQFDYGLSVTLAPQEQMSWFALHVNLGGTLVEGGATGLRYRIGPSLSLPLSPGASLRFFAYADGFEWGGRADTDLDLEFGLQLLLAEHVQFTVVAGKRVSHSGYRDDLTRRALDDLGVRERHADEDRESIEVTLGFIF